MYSFLRSWWIALKHKCFETRPMKRPSSLSFPAELIKLYVTFLPIFCQFPGPTAYGIQNTQTYEICCVLFETCTTCTTCTTHGPVAQWSTGPLSAERERVGKSGSKRLRTTVLEVEAREIPPLTTQTVHTGQQFVAEARILLRNFSCNSTSKLFNLLWSLCLNTAMKTVFTY